LASPFALAQNPTLYVPDNLANAGTCNAIPFSPSFAAATTYVGRIPATFLGTGPITIRDFEFAPCAGGTFSAANIQMGMGHVPNPVPNPFTFPTFDAAGNVISLGSFLDYTPFWNSVIQGPFGFTMVQDTWSPMGLATSTSTGFGWNGTDDIGFYVTYNTATGGGSFHRTTAPSTEPYRLYASGTYQAGTSTGSGANGLKMGLVTGWAPLCTGCGNLTMAIGGSPAIGGSVIATMGNYGTGIPGIGLGFAPFCFAPYCTICTIGHNWMVGIMGSSLTMSIPNDPSYIGMQIGIQGGGLFTTGGCAASSISLGDTYVLTITP
jgi:hypothetical protein